MEELFAVALFVLVLVFIGSELANRTVVALIGAILIVAFGVVEQSEAASEFIDWNTIGLLAGMMIIVAILNKTGLFEYLAIRSAQLGKARPGRILILLSLVTAFLSAFLDNVTTVILMVPVTFLIADALNVSPLPFLLAQVMASNIGGAATLIGDPPNILIGSAASLSFTDWDSSTWPSDASYGRAKTQKRPSGSWTRAVPSGIASSCASRSSSSAWSSSASSCTGPCTWKPLP
jgi:Na+/H+ antiporter NhaD/arsenite permease-like protein